METEIERSILYEDEEGYRVEIQIWGHGSVIVAKHLPTRFVRAQSLSPHWYQNWKSLLEELKCQVRASQQAKEATDMAMKSKESEFLTAEIKNAGYKILGPLTYALEVKEIPQHLIEEVEFLKGQHEMTLAELERTRAKLSLIETVATRSATEKEDLQSRMSKLEAREGKLTTHLRRAHISEFFHREATSATGSDPVYRPKDARERSVVDHCLKEFAAYVLKKAGLDPDGAEE